MICSPIIAKPLPSLTPYILLINHEATGASKSIVVIPQILIFLSLGFLRLNKVTMIIPTIKIIPAYNSYAIFPLIVSFTFSEVFHYR